MHMHRWMHTLTGVCTLSQEHAHSHRLHAHFHRSTHTLTGTCTPSQWHTNSQRYQTLTGAYTLSQVYAHSHSFMCTLKRAWTLTGTYTYTQMNKQIFLKNVSLYRPQRKRKHIWIYSWKCKDRDRDREWKRRERELLTTISHNITEYFLYYVTSDMPLFSDIYQEVHQYAILENSLLECCFTSSKGWGNVLNCWLSFIFWYFRRWSLNI